MRGRREACGGGVDIRDFGSLGETWRFVGCNYSRLLALLIKAIEVGLSKA